MHVLTETFIGVAIVVVQIFSRHIHASRDSPAQRSDGLKHNVGHGGGGDGGHVGDVGDGGGGDGGGQ